MRTSCVNRIQIKILNHFCALRMMQWRNFRFFLLNENCTCEKPALGDFNYRFRARKSRSPVTVTFGRSCIFLHNLHMSERPESLPVKLLIKLWQVRTQLIHHSSCLFFLSSFIGHVASQLTFYELKLFLPAPYEAFCRGCLCPSSSVLHDSFLILQLGASINYPAFV